MTSAPLALTGGSTNAACQDDLVLVDALPYLDTDYNETDRQMALRLIDQECKVFRPTKNYLKHLAVPDYDIFLSPLLIREHARMSKKQELQKLDMSRCELPSPHGTSRAADKNQWRKAIKNAKAQNEHLVLRQINLDMLSEYAGEAYLKNNKDLEQVLTEAEKDLLKTKEQVMEVHARRKMAQMDAGRQLKELEQHWVSLVTNNYRMELAVNQMEENNAIACKRLRLDPATVAKKST